jgi:hypothetical protein
VLKPSSPGTKTQRHVYFSRIKEGPASDGNTSAEALFPSNENPTSDIYLSCTKQDPATDGKTTAETLFHSKADPASDRNTKFCTKFCHGTHGHGCCRMRADDDGDDDEN